MSTAGDIVGAVLGIAGDVLKTALELIDRGEPTKAREVVARFEAATRRQLDADREAAEDILRRRFPDSQPPSSP